MTKLLLVPLLLYLLVLILLYALQTRIIFPAGHAGAAAALPSGAQRLTVRTGGETLEGLHISPNSAAGAGPVILGFGGNAWNAAAAAAYLRQLYPSFDIVVFHYRGYRPSSGVPGAGAITADSLAIFDEVVRRFPARPVVAVGFSLGSGVAAFLASKRSLAGAILVTPFDSLAKVAAGHYPWLPVRLLFRHPMPSAEWLGSTRTPVAILAAGQDSLIPPARTNALRSAMPNLVFDRTIAGATHNDIYDRGDFIEAMHAALRRILQAKSLAQGENEPPQR